MRILLADDDEDQLELRSLLLAENGHETIAVTTAAAALQEAKARRPQCAVIDLKIPTEALGLALIRDLKELDAAIRVFVLTGGDAKRINGLPEKNMVEEVLVKGSSTAYLLKKLAELASEKGAPETAPVLREFLQNHEEPKLVGLRASLAKHKVVTFDVKAVPRSARSEVAGITTDGAMKVRVAAVPDKGKANEELRDLLACWFKVPKSNVELLRGETSQRKVLRVRK